MATQYPEWQDMMLRDAEHEDRDKVDWRMMCADTLYLINETLARFT
jgi:hypothetical protein